jgi:Domain of unknown function DUF29
MTKYEVDFLEWSRETGELIRDGKLAEVDTEHLAEEIEDLGNSLPHSLRSRLRQVLMHLLKIRYQGYKQQHLRSWQTSVRNQRFEIEDIMSDSPSLGRAMESMLASCYDTAREMAEEETGLPISIFPVECPWSLAQIMNRKFWSEVHVER